MRDFRCLAQKRDSLMNDKGKPEDQMLEISLSERLPKFRYFRALP